jgi:4-amino-4-deoxy-L-arabinose transferase-like glycosyltransferase
VSTLSPPPTTAPPQTDPAPRPARVPLLARLVERRWACVLILALWCGCLFFHGLGGSGFGGSELYRTESLRAIIAAEFLRSGNWVVPTLYGEALFTKPPGMYAAIALVSWPFGGVSEWTARLPSALAGTAVVFLFYWYFGRQLGRLGGLVAGLLVPIGFMWIDKTPSAEIDTLQVAWVTASVLFLLRALDEDDKVTRWQGDKVTQETPDRHVLAMRVQVPTDGTPSPCPPVALSPCHPVTLSPCQGWGWWLAALLCVAGGFLTKWTAPAFFYATAVPLLWWRGRLRLLFGRQHLLSAAAAASLCLAWVAAAASLGGWDNFTETVKREALQRLVPNYSARPYSWPAALTHPAKLLITTLPLSALALVTFWPGFWRLWDERGRRLLQALRCWAWPNVLIWSLMSEHAPRHSFPLFPAIAGLGAMVWLAWLQGKLPWGWLRIRPAPTLVVLLVLWLGAKAVFVHAWVPNQRNVSRQPRAKGQLLAALVPPGQVLYLFHLKDEGIMFYYGRPVVRLARLADLPSRGEAVYCILTKPELKLWRTSRPVEVVREMQDEQGDPMFLVRVGSEATREQTASH